MAHPVIDCTGVEVREEHVDALRSLLKEEPRAWDPFERAESEAEAIAYHVTLYAAFTVAVGRKFSPRYSFSQVIRFVADLRINLKKGAEKVHPRVAEEMIREALGEPNLESIDLLDGETAIMAEVVVLLTLLDEAELDEAGLEEFIKDSVDFARGWVAARQGESSGS
ncbi:hypothetical protein [Actinomadura sp. 7K507]|uniref:hypothetical protein n=1 Tax=Actinomadura sp. 7K507 TaxID=2530365 RepID=UPI00104A83D3|nr:hypothetical protein [Actinomadura sp. 7K507]TDC97716.1 hypothetical protein E1285_02515 [Actinomadura sp. 7K507]